jgi:AmmeMemoRadiSam system protein A
MQQLSELGPLLPAVARRAIRSWLFDGIQLAAARSDAPCAPVFVTLRTADGNLRGCIGSLVAVEPDVVAETARSAVLAATRDHRFLPVRCAELDGLRIEVSVLLPHEPVASLAELDPARWGVVVTDSSGRRGLLLPEVPGIEDAVTQVQVARRKAGLADGVPVSLWRFGVQKFVDG